MSVSESSDLLREIQIVLRGHSTLAVLPALMQAMVIVIGVACRDLASAQALIDALPEQLKPALRAQWDSFQTYRAKMPDDTAP